MGEGTIPWGKVLCKKSLAGKSGELYTKDTEYPYRDLGRMGLSVKDNLKCIRSFDPKMFKEHFKVLEEDK